ncbi:hypothetical protein QCA50_006630 [Cerrena zonata]|uniref:MFS general substrate transporter n=1 Tax=Cerrena zonata TaxID=2478898 RepID=A0AAW0GID2_9APHY
MGSLFISLLVALASGTNYAFSAYGPQLASRLHLTHTRLNVISISGTIGVYGTAPFMGKLVDAKGPRPLLAIAFFSLLIGYSGVRHFYARGLPEGTTDLSNWVFGTLMVCGFLTGIGANGGIMSAMNATAKSFPDRARATTTGLVLSMFGLSAFIFSIIGHTLFPGDTASLLLTLAIGTSLPMIVGFFFVRPIPLPSSDHDEHSHERQEGQDSHTPLLANQDVSEPSEDDAYAPGGKLQADPSQNSVASDYTSAGSLNSTPLRRVPSNSSLRERTSISTKAKPVDPRIRGMALAMSVDFWLLFITTVLLSGTALMFISNVGLISQALYAYATPVYDETQALEWQAKQVSSISIFNCMGRIIIGLIADTSRHIYHTPRSYFIPLVSLLFVISQMTALSITEVDGLWKASSLLGLSYGCLFGLFPAVTIEWFGLHHFSENWGFMSLAPVIGSNILSIAFGRIFDAHTHPAPEVNFASTMNTRSAPSDSHSLCLEGRACYADSLRLTISACSLAFVLGVYVAYRDWKKMKEVGVSVVERAG